MNWRKEISPGLKPFIEKLISESLKEKGWRNSKNPSKSQLWIAIGILSRQAYDLEIKCRFLEQALKEISPKYRNQGIRKAETEFNKIISEIAGGKRTRIKKKKRKK
ncbi:MAG: hypothetical protein JSW08_01310 [archaeon]|nr:MAG: hypothetical protein JSW08_01310 [archaeon]